AIAVGPALRGCPVQGVQGSMGDLNQRRLGDLAIRAIALGAKAVKRRQRAAWSDVENRAVVIGPAVLGCSVELSIGGLNQPCNGESAVRVVKGIYRRQRAIRGYFEDRAGAVGPDPALVRCPVEVPVSGLDEPRPGY